jgi:hypothetical protein
VELKKLKIFYRRISPLSRPSSDSERLYVLKTQQSNACKTSSHTTAARWQQNPKINTYAMPRSKLDPSLRNRVHSLIFLDPKPRPTTEQTTASAASEPQRPSSCYLDPNTTLPEAYQPRSRWRGLLKKLRLGAKLDPEEKKLGPPSASLTERNLTEFFDPHCSSNVDVYQEVRVRRHQKKKSISEWIEKLP